MLTAAWEVEGSKNLHIYCYVIYIKWICSFSNKNLLKYKIICIHAHLFYLYSLTHSTVQSPTWETNWFAASQEILRISRNPKVHYRTHKRPPPVPILGQPNPSIYPHPTSWRSVLILSTHLRLGLPIGLFPSSFPTKTLYILLSSPIHNTCPAHLIFIWDIKPE